MKWFDNLLITNSMKKILILSGLSLLVALAVRAQDKVTEYNVRPAVAVRTPLQGDSINFTGEKFTADALLKTDISLDSVSYTHLDVYKRQDLWFTGCAARCIAGYLSRDWNGENRTSNLP